MIALYDVKDIEVAKKLGIVEARHLGKVTGFEEKPAEPKSTLASIGVYLFTRETVKKVDEYLNTGHSPDKPGEFVQWLYKEEDVYGFAYNDMWFDIGSFDQLEKARQEYRG